jgi:LmbE family N-acetylglucosaminyl deacetylase
MLTARDRLARRKSRPAIVALHRALSRLTSTLTVMNTGAHPDDEQSGMLALLRFGMGMRVIVACSTRGEGGQNTLGPERTGALGVLRSREMEEAARELDADVVWLGHGPDDPVHDFGFSKSGPDTLARWGKDRIIERLVRAYRQERPDIVIPTFLDVPGQHGHHRAMTEAAETAIALAADLTAYPEHFAEGLTPWRVAKYYLPAWSGGGDTYDDEVPPPPATLTVAATGSDPLTGASYDTLGEFSRYYHASQNMGHWRAEPQTAWPLHLKLGGAAEDDIRANLPANLTEIAALLASSASAPLRAADAAIADAIAAFPDGATIVGPLDIAKSELLAAQAALTEPEAELFGHRLARKLAEIDAALIAASGLDILAWVEPTNLAPGGSGQLKVWLGNRHATIRPVLAPHLHAGTPSSEGPVTSIPLSVAADAPITNAYLPGYSSLGGNGAVQVEVTLKIGSHAATELIDTEEPVQIVPSHAVSLVPDALIIPLPAAAIDHTVAVQSGASPQAIAIDETPGITITRSGNGFTVRADASLPAGRLTLPVTIDGAPAYNLTPIAYLHIGRTHFVRPQALDILALDLVLPQSRIGYVGGGSDRVGLWLARMGADVTELDAAALEGDLSAYDTIVIGIFAFGTRPDLARAVPRLHRWVESGGHLLTLYHRPSDGWNPDATPPRRLVIGSPSLRWRVTNPAVDVSSLLPQSPLMSFPNRLSANDFAGWDKERGLYFAAEWDDAYQPLLSMHDSGEQPLLGSLLTAQIGRGRHTHTSLVLHHQLDKLVPGAFRILANLVQKS